MKKLVVLCCFLPVLAFAQNNEINFTLGAIRTAGQSGSVTASAPLRGLFPTMQRDYGFAGREHRFCL